MTLRWEPVPYRSNTVDCFADVPGLGRFLIRIRKNKRRTSTQHIIYLNGNMTAIRYTLKEATDYAEEVVATLDKAPQQTRD